MRIQALSLLITGVTAITVAGAGSAVGAPAQPATAPAAPTAQGGQPQVVPLVDCDPTGQSGGSVDQSTVLARAAAWVADNVPYNTNGCAHRAEGSYREDCSGFVSMAWALATSLSTWGFNPATNGGDPRFVPIARASLIPGDALVVDNSSANHIALFTGWGTSDAGRHRYANLSEESQPGVGTIALTNQDLLGYWSVYTPIHYTHLTGSPSGSRLGASAVSPTSSQVNFYFQGAGAVQVRGYVNGSGWAPNQDLGAPPGGLSWDPDAGSWGSGHVDLATRTGQGQLATRAYDRGTGWTPWSVHTGTTLSSSPTVVDDAVGNVDVFYLGPNHGLINVHWAASTGWTGPRAVPGVTNAVSGPDASAGPLGNAHIDVGYRSTANTLWVVTYNNGWTAAKQVSGTNPLPATPAAVDPGTGNTGSFSVYYTATDGMIYHSGWDPTTHAWTAWYAVPGGAAATAAPDAASESATHIDLVTAYAGNPTTASWNGTAWSTWHYLP